jgi:hypothetical protein
MAPITQSCTQTFAACKSGASAAVPNIDIAKIILAFFIGCFLSYYLELLKIIFVDGSKNAPPALQTYVVICTEKDVCHRLWCHCGVGQSIKSPSLANTHYRRSRWGSGRCVAIHYPVRSPKARVHPFASEGDFMLCRRA